MPICVFTIYSDGREEISYTLYMPSEQHAMQMLLMIAEALACKLGAPRREGGEVRAPCPPFTIGVKCGGEP